MRAFPIVAALVLMGAIGVVLYVRGTDPRPVAAEMRARLTEASAGLKAVDPAEHGFAMLIGAYEDAAAGMGRVALDYVSDIDIHDFAERLAEAPEIAARLGEGRDGGAETFDGFGAIHAEAQAELADGIAHIGTPDEIFVRTMLALYGGSVAIAETALAEGTDAALQPVAEDIVLLNKSAIGSMNRWLADNNHAH